MQTGTRGIFELKRPRNGLARETTLQYIEACGKEATVAAIVKATDDKDDLIRLKITDTVYIWAWPEEFEILNEKDV